MECDRPEILLPASLSNSRGNRMTVTSDQAEQHHRSASNSETALIGNRLQRRRMPERQSNEVNRKQAIYLPENAYSLANGAFRLSSGSSFLVMHARRPRSLQPAADTNLAGLKVTTRLRSSSRPRLNPSQRQQATVQPVRCAPRPDDHTGEDDLLDGCEQWLPLLPLGLGEQHHSRRVEQR